MSRWAECGCMLLGTATGWKKSLQVTLRTVLALLVKQSCRRVARVFVSAQVLSVVAQQLLTIQNALRANLDKFWFEGRPIRLQQTCGVFSECVERG